MHTCVKRSGSCTSSASPALQRQPRSAAVDGLVCLQQSLRSPQNATLYTFGYIRKCYGSSGPLRRTPAQVDGARPSAAQEEDDEPSQDDGEGDDDERAPDYQNDESSVVGPSAAELAQLAVSPLSRS